MAREAGQALTSFNVRKQFVDGNTVCSIIDWEMAMPRSCAARWHSRTNEQRVSPSRSAGPARCRTAAHAHPNVKA